MFGYTLRGIFFSRMRTLRVSRSSEYVGKASPLVGAASACLRREAAITMASSLMIEKASGLLWGLSNNDKGTLTCFPREGGGAWLPGDAWREEEKGVTWVDVELIPTFSLLSQLPRVLGCQVSLGSRGKVRVFFICILLHLSSSPGFLLLRCPSLLFYLKGFAEASSPRPCLHPLSVPWLHVLSFSLAVSSAGLWRKVR